jgi:predicted nucleic acid-binding protein
VISITAAKEFLAKGDVNVLREFLTARSGSIGRAASAEQIASLQAQAEILGRVLKAKDAAVAGSALRHNAIIITGDRRFLKFLEEAGIPVEGF